MEHFNKLTPAEAERLVLLADYGAILTEGENA